MGVAMRENFSVFGEKSVAGCGSIWQENKNETIGNCP
jgi:hypothetical protein